MTTRLLCPWNSPGKNTGVGSHFLLQGIFPTQGLTLGLPHHRQILYRLSHQGSRFYDKNSLGTEGNFLNLINSIYEKPTANFTFNGEKQDTFSLRLGTRLECLLLPFLFNIKLERSSPSN